MDLHFVTTGPETADVSFVFIHAPGLDHTCFRPFVDPLADDYRLVFYDQRLSGRAPRTPDDEIAFDVIANDAIAVIRQVSAQAPVLVAHSYSAWTAIRAAVETASPVAGLVLISPGLSPTVVETLMAHVIRRGNAEQRRYLDAAFAGQLATDQMFGDAWRSVIPLYLARFDRATVDDVHRRMSFSAAGFNAFVSSGFTAFDWQKAARRLRIPVLVCGGAHDWLEGDPLGGSRAVADVFPTADFHLFPDSGHYCFFEEPHAVVARFRAWATDRRSSLLAKSRS